MQGTVPNKAGAVCRKGWIRTSRAGSSCAGQHAGEMLDDDVIFDDDAPLLSDIHITETAKTAYGSGICDEVLTRNSCQVIKAYRLS